MNLTKFGISTALIAAIGYFAGYVSLIPVVLLFIFVLYTDMQTDVKKNVTQAVILSAFFGILGVVLSACSSTYISFINWLYEVVSYSMMSVVDVFANLNIFKWLGTIANLLEFALMIYGIVAALSGRVVKFPIVTKMVAKHFGEEAAPKQ